MSDTPGKPWLPNTLRSLHFWEEANFTGVFMGGVLYGM